MAYHMPKLENDANWFLSNVFLKFVLEWGDLRFADAVSKEVLELIRAKPQAALFNFLMEQPEDIRDRSCSVYTVGHGSG